MYLYSRALSGCVYSLVAMSYASSMTSSSESSSIVSSVWGLDMCPHRPMKPPEVLIEGVLVMWRIRIDQSPLPGLPQLDVLVVLHAPILLIVPLPVVILATKR
jgi:hypothetical protein